MSFLLISFKRITSSGYHETLQMKIMIVCFPMLYSAAQDSVIPIRDFLICAQTLHLSP